MLGHTSSILNPVKTGRVLNTNSRVVRQEKVRLDVKRCWAAPVSLSCRVGSKWSAGSGTEGTLTPFAGVCTNTSFISSMCGKKKSKCLEKDVGQAEVLWGKTESKDDPPIPLPKVAQASPITKGDTGGQTDSPPHSLHLPGKVRCWHPKADEGNFSSYSITSFNSLAFP